MVKTPDKQFGATQRRSKRQNAFSNGSVVMTIITTVLKNPISKQDIYQLPIGCPYLDNLALRNDAQMSKCLFKWFSGNHNCNHSFEKSHCETGDFSNAYWLSICGQFGATQRRRSKRQNAFSNGSVVMTIVTTV